MKRSTILLLLICLFQKEVFLQNNYSGFKTYRAAIQRNDGYQIPFILLSGKRKGKQVWVIKNGKEEIELKNLPSSTDSIIVEFPVFESQLHMGQIHEGSYQGLWFKGAPGGFNTQKISVYTSVRKRFSEQLNAPKYNVKGRWSVVFKRPDNSARPAVAEFNQDGNYLTGSFLTPSGDYRYLEGIVSGDSLKLSTFDGSHAFYFQAKINGEDEITNGLYCSGTAHTETWTAKRNEHAVLPFQRSTDQFSEDERQLSFSFPDLDGQSVSLKDDRFKGKVVIIQLMGSWCSNCMDETAFLSDYYQKNRNKGIEMIGLAYEYSTDFERSKKSLSKFKQRFNIQYPLLITGASAGDSLRMEKTLPRLSAFTAIPTTLFIAKDGTVKKIHAGFYGPGSGKDHEDEIREFDQTVRILLAE
ncbi:MAG: peroxiredoxin family protein [Chitinophagales bacterium]